MKLLVLPMLLAFSYLYDAHVITRLFGEWTVRRKATASPVDVSTKPAQSICHASLSIADTLDVAHVIYKARVLPGTVWSHVTVYGHTVSANSSVDGTEVRVLAADADPLTPGHAVCPVVLMQNVAEPEAQKLEVAILDAGAA